jgi:phage recombination protein Bet
MMEFAGLTWIDQRPDPQNPGQTVAVRSYAPSGIMAAFIGACARTGLDPTAKQIYAALMGGKWTVLVGIDGMRVVAQRTGQYDGQDPIEWQAAADGPWTTVPPKTPFAARVRVYRKGISRPIEQTVTFAEFGGAKNNWDKRPAHMLGIRAESHALRRLFPMELAGLYTPEDFQDDVDTTDAITAADSEPWGDLIAGAEDRAALDAIAERLAASGEGTDKLRAAWLARAGLLSREANTVDADVVDEEAQAPAEDAAAAPADAVEPDPESAPDAPAASSAGMTEAEYEAAEAVRYDAAVAAGEVPRD